MDAAGGKISEFTQPEYVSILLARNEKARQSRALNGGRCRDRTYDLSRVKGTLSR